MTQILSALILICGNNTTCRIEAELCTQKFEVTEKNTKQVKQDIFKFCYESVREGCGE